MQQTDTAQTARERILLTAHDLFYRDGIRATGIDKIIREAKVTKVTFYRHFPGKHDLIQAFLEYRHRRWMDWFREALARHGAVAGGGLRPLQGAMEEWFGNPLFRGCAFINTAAELGGACPDLLEICSKHKLDMILAIAELLPESAARLDTAYAAAVAVDGAIVRAQMETGPAGDRQSLRSLAILLKGLEQGRA